jgi:hypothetical protein
LTGACGTTVDETKNISTRRTDPDKRSAGDALDVMRPIDADGRLQPLPALGYLAGHPEVRVEGYSPRCRPPHAIAPALFRLGGTAQLGFG